MTTLTLELPDRTVQDLAKRAVLEKRSIPELALEAITQWAELDRAVDNWAGAVQQLAQSTAETVAVAAAWRADLQEWCRERSNEPA